MWSSSVLSPRKIRKAVIGDMVAPVMTSRAELPHLVDNRGRAGNDPADQVAMSAEVLRRRVHDEIGAGRIGRCSAGVAKVLSTKSRAPVARASLTTARMSMISRLGFAGVSKKTIFVLAPSAARNSAGVPEVDDPNGDLESHEMLREERVGVAVLMPMNDDFVARADQTEDHRAHRQRCPRRRPGPLPPPRDWRAVPPIGSVLDCVYARRCTRAVRHGKRLPHLPPFRRRRSSWRKPAA